MNAKQKAVLEVYSLFILNIWPKTSLEDKELPNSFFRCLTPHPTVLDSMIDILFDKLSKDIEILTLSQL